MVVNDIKDIVKGTAELQKVISGGIMEYIVTDINGNRYQLSIDVSDKHDVGESASFMPFYDKAITLMRWIRRANENNELIRL